MTARNRRSTDDFTLRVPTNGRHPMIKLPSLDTLPSRPTGDIIAPECQTWTFRFPKELCNVAYPESSDGTNQLPTLRRECSARMREGREPLLM